MEQLEVNTKFLNSLSPEWSKFVIDVKLVKDFHTSNYDQVHAYLEQHELHANKVSQSAMTLLNTLLETCATLTKQVANLEQDKIAQAVEITKLKKRAKRLKKKRQFKSSGLKRRMHPNRVKIAKLDADEDVTLEDIDAEVAMDADVHGRLEKSQAKVYHLDLQHAKKVLSMQDTNKEEPAEVEEVIEVVTTAICKLKDTIKSLRKNNKEEIVDHDRCDLATINEELENSVAKLLSENERLCKEINHVKQVFKDQFDSIKQTRVLQKEQSDTLNNKPNLKFLKNKDLKAQIQDKVFVITSLKNDLRKLKGKAIIDNAVQIPSAITVAPRMSKLDLEPLAPKLVHNRESHSYYLKHT
nr:integrase, catalytic region, zinc finger, CCHC-type, peptidase aspartic, catalytic [Tanacetum cinerariifolium]